MNIVYKLINYPPIHAIWSRFTLLEWCGWIAVTYFIAGLILE